MSITEDIRATEEEIERTNQQILKVREELLAMENGDFSWIHKRPKESFKVIGSDYLHKNFITRAFVHRIYGYPEFENVLLKSFVSFAMKTGYKQTKTKIAQVVDLKYVVESYRFEHNQNALHTKTKIVVHLSDGIKRTLALFEILDKIPDGKELAEYRLNCSQNKIKLPSKESAEEKELMIIDTAARILSTNERILADEQRTDLSCTIQQHGRLKMFARRAIEMARFSNNNKEKAVYKSELKRLNRRSVAISNIPRANRQECIEKMLQERHRVERVENRGKGEPNEPTVMEGIQRVHTVDSQIEMSMLAKEKKKQVRRKKDSAAAKEIHLDSPPANALHVSTNNPTTTSNPIPRRINAKPVVIPETTVDDLYEFHRLADLEVGDFLRLTREDD